MQDLPFLSWLTLVDMGWIMEGLSKVCSIRGRFCVLTGDGMYLENGLSLGQFR